MKDKSGLRFLEIFVVLIILSVVSLLVVPQFSQAAQDSKTGKLCRELQRIRSHINVYKAQHENRLPGSGNLGFVESLTSLTSSLGNKYNPGVSETAVLVCGPYISHMPKNPFNGLNTVDTNGCAGDGSHGWYFEAKTGALIADDSIDNSRL